MISTRVIPCLLLKNGGFVKTRRFKEPKYLGDPRNITRIFSEKEADELVVLDIRATLEKRGPDVSLIREIVDEAFVPVAYGGGITSIQEAHEILSLGVEKVVLNSGAHSDPQLITDAAREFGRQSVVVSLDVETTWLKKRRIMTRCGKTKTRWTPEDYARNAEERGAGELLIQSIDRDGTMDGYDIPLIRSIVDSVSIPVIACSGASSVSHLAQAVHEGGASAVAAGSMFVFNGPHRAVLISFPDQEVLASAGLRNRTAVPSQLASMSADGTGEDASRATPTQ